MAAGTWLKLMDTFPEHPKVLSAGPQAAWLYVCGLAYCSRLLTDGRIPRSAALRLADIQRPQQSIDKLVAAGLWTEVDDAYVVHDYADHQRTSEEVEASREAARERQRRSRASRNKVTGKSRRDKPVSHAPVTLAEAETETKKKRTPAEASPSAEAARNLVTAFWDTSNPKPAVKFIALLKLAEGFLDAGWTQQQLMKGLRQTRAFTTDAIEFTLRQNAEPPRQSKSDQAVVSLQGWLDNGAPTPFAIGQGGQG